MFLSERPQQDCLFLQTTNKKLFIRLRLRCAVVDHLILCMCFVCGFSDLRDLAWGLFAFLGPMDSGTAPATSYRGGASLRAVTSQPRETCGGTFFYSITSTESIMSYKCQSQLAWNINSQLMSCETAATARFCNRLCKTLAVLVDWDLFFCCVGMRSQLFIG